MVLECQLPRLNYIFQNSPTCMFPVMKGHKAETCQITEEATILVADPLM